MTDNHHGREHHDHGKHKGHSHMNEPGPIPIESNPFDLNGDGCVDEADEDILREAFGSAKGDPNYNPACDFNGDGLVNSADFNLFRTHIGEGCTPTSS